MPKKVLPKRLAYQGLVACAHKLSFVRIGSQEEKRQLEKMRIDVSKPPRPQFKDDIYVFYSLSGYRVKFRTTVKEEPYEVADSDEAWVMIENAEGKAVAYAPPFHRTENFLQNLLDFAEVFKILIENLPLCSCGSEIIFTNPSVRVYEIKCYMHEIALDHSIDGIDIYEFVFPFLPERLKKAVKKRLSKERYNETRADEEDKVFGQRILTRRPHLKKK